MVHGYDRVMVVGAHVLALRDAVDPHRRVAERELGVPILTVGFSGDQVCGSNRVVKVRQIELGITRSG